MLLTANKIYRSFTDNAKVDVVRELKIDTATDAATNAATDAASFPDGFVIPSFVEPHCHFAGWALSRIRLQLHNCITVDALSGAISERLNRLPVREWLIANGYQDALITQLNESGKLPQFFAQFSAEHPIVLISRDGHSLVLNQTALERLPLTRSDLVESGGVVETDRRGELTGLFREEAAFLIRHYLPESDLTPTALHSACLDVLRVGVTQIHDMDGLASLKRFAHLDEKGLLPLKVTSHLLASDLENIEQVRRLVNASSNRLKLGGLKLFLDGTLGSGTALLHEPVSGGPHAGNTGVSFYQHEELCALIKRGADLGLSPLIHAIGDRAFTDAVAALQDTQPSWSRLPSAPRIEHAQLITPSDLALCAKLGVTLSIQPSMLLSDRKQVEEYWGETRATRAFAYRSMLNAGCRLLIGSDAPIEPLDPLAAIRAAISRAENTDHITWHKEQALRPFEAFAAATAHRTLSSSDARDFIVLSTDPLRENHEDTQIDHVYVSGRIAYSQDA